MDPLCTNCHFLRKIKYKDLVKCRMGNLPKEHYNYNFDNQEISFHYDFNFTCKLFYLDIVTKGDLKDAEKADRLFNININSTK